MCTAGCAAPLRSPRAAGAGPGLRRAARPHARAALPALPRARLERMGRADPANAALDAALGVAGARLPRRPGAATFAARMGLYSFDAGTPLTAGSWRAARSGGAPPLQAARGGAGRERSAFALTRPPGHHAGAGLRRLLLPQQRRAGGADAARRRRRASPCSMSTTTTATARRRIFYERADVLTISIHGDPRTEYPFFLGHADERRGAGEGCNLNLPLPRGTGCRALDGRRSMQALDAVRAFRRAGAGGAARPGHLRGRPDLRLPPEERRLPARRRALASLALPTVFCFEGGYAVAEVGINAVNVLEGFQRPEEAPNLPVHALGAAHQRHEAVDADVAARQRHADALAGETRSRCASARPARRRPRARAPASSVRRRSASPPPPPGRAREHVLHVALITSKGCCPPPASAGRRRWCAAPRC